MIAGVNHLLQAERIERALSRDKRRKARLEAADIDYEYTPLSKALEKPTKKKHAKEPTTAAIENQPPSKKTKRKGDDVEKGKVVKKAKKLAKPV